MRSAAPPTEPDTAPLGATRKEVIVFVIILAATVHMFWAVVPRFALLFY
jgi:hypothetical protein